MLDFTWYQLDSDSFPEVLAEKDGTVITDRPGVYAWRLAFTFPDDVLHSSQAMQAWIEKICIRPSAKLKNGRITTSISTDLTIGGVGLTKEKHRTVEKLSSTKNGRAILASYVASLHAFSPVLYVGMAENLSVRLKQHLNGQTDFANQINNTYPFGFDDLTFYYCPIGDSPSDKHQKVLTLLEMIFQRSVSPPGVTRAG